MAHSQMQEHMLFRWMSLKSTIWMTGTCPSVTLEDRLHLGNTKKNKFFLGISLDLHYLCKVKYEYK